MARLKRLRKITNDLNDAIGRMSDREITNLIRECGRVTTTNCWCLMYDLKDIVAETAKSWLSYRQQQRRKQKEGGD